MPMEKKLTSGLTYFDQFIHSNRLKLNETAFFSDNRPPTEFVLKLHKMMAITNGIQYEPNTTTYEIEVFLSTTTHGISQISFPITHILQYGLHSSSPCLFFWNSPVSILPCKASQLDKDESKILFHCGPQFK